MKKNPCDTCIGGEKFEDCVMGGIAKDDACYNSECFVNFSDTNTCLLGICRDCGAWKDSYDS